MMPTVNGTVISTKSFMGFPCSGPRANRAFIIFFRVELDGSYSFEMWCWVSTNRHKRTREEEGSENGKSHHGGAVPLCGFCDLVVSIYQHLRPRNEFVYFGALLNSIEYRSGHIR